MAPRKGQRYTAHHGSITSSVLEILSDSKRHPVEEIQTAVGCTRNALMQAMYRLRRHGKICIKFAYHGGARHYWIAEPGQLDPPGEGPDIEAIVALRESVQLYKERLTRALCSRCESAEFMGLDVNGLPACFNPPCIYHRAVERQSASADERNQFRRVVTKSA